MGRTLLLVDPDLKSLRVLEVSLKKAGFRVFTAERYEEALEIVRSRSPDLILTETFILQSSSTSSSAPHVRSSGFQFVREVRALGQNPLVLFLAEDDRPAAKVEAINLGAADFLVKPVLVREVLDRVRTLLTKYDTTQVRERERPSNLSGSLAHMGVVDLLQLMESGRRSGVIHVSSDQKRSGGFVEQGEQVGTLFLHEGRVVDANVHRLRGAEAVYRLLMWEDGAFEIEFKNITRSDNIGLSTPALLLEGMRRIDEWSRVKNLLPPLSTVLEFNPVEWQKEHISITPSLRKILEQVDGKRSLLELLGTNLGVDSSPALFIGELFRKNILLPVLSSSTTDSRESSLVMKLEVPPLGVENEEMIDELDPHHVPSIFERAFVPSKQSPSEIILNQNKETDPQSKENTPIPELIPESEDSEWGSVLPERPFIPPYVNAHAKGNPETDPGTEDPTERAPDRNMREDVWILDRAQTTENTPGEGNARVVIERVHTPNPLFQKPIDLLERKKALSTPLPRRISSRDDPKTEETRREPWNLVQAQLKPEPASKELGEDDVVLEWMKEYKKNKRIRFVVASFVLIILGLGIHLVLPNKLSYFVEANRVFSDRAKIKREQVRQPTLALRTTPDPNAIKNKITTIGTQGDSEKKQFTKPIDVETESVKKVTERPAEAYLKHHNYSKAAELFAELKARGNNNAKIESGLALIYYNQGKRKEAELAAERALQFEPKHARAHLVLGMLWQEQGRYKDARSAFEQYLDKEPHGDYAREVRRTLTSAAFIRAKSN